MTKLFAHLCPSGDEIDLSSPLTPIWQRLYEMGRAFRHETIGPDSDVPADAQAHRAEAAQVSGGQVTRTYVLLAPKGVDDEGAVEIVSASGEVHFDALDADSAVGTATISWRKGENPHRAWVGVFVRPEFRRKGIGRAALEFLRGIALENSKTTLFTWTGERTLSPDAVGALLPHKGPGTLDPTSASASFLLAGDFGLDMVQKVSAFHLGEGEERSALRDRLAAEYEATTERYNPAGEYDILEWTAPTPEEHMERYVAMGNRFLADVPAMSGEAANRITADIQREIEKHLVESGLTQFNTVARHRETGEFVGMTIVNWREGAETGFIDSTWVATEHRGHRFGYLLKLHSALALLDRAPEMKKIVTWNAEENAHMWAINEQLGYVVDDGQGGWLSHFVDGAWRARS